MITLSGSVLRGFLFLPEKKCPKKIRTAEIPFPKSDPDFLHKKTFRQSVSCAESGGNRDPCRRHHLPFHIRQAQRNPVRLRDIQNRGYRNRKLPVLAVDKSRPFRQSRDHAFGDAKIVVKNRRRNNVHNGVQRSHLMKMNLFDRTAVRGGFRLRNDPENLPRQLPCAIAHLPAVDHLIHIGKVPVLVRMLMMVFLMMMILMRMFVRMPMMVFLMMMMFMRMLMRMVFRVVSIQKNLKIAAVEPVGFPAGDSILESVQIQTFQDGVQFFLVRAEIQQSCRGHIAADSAGPFQIKQLTHIGLTPRLFRVVPGENFPARFGLMNPGFLQSLLR